MEDNLGVMEGKDLKHRYKRLRASEAGNIFTSIIAALVLVGLINAGAMQTMTGPVKTMAGLNQKARAESEILIASKIAMTHIEDMANQGDCDDDQWPEPEPYDASTSPAPTGGGGVPLVIGTSRRDPWGTPYGYCTWDHGPDFDTGSCNGQNRLQGNEKASSIAIAMISAGPDKTFQTNCHPYDGTAPEGVEETGGSDDILLKYTTVDIGQSTNTDIGGDTIWEQRPSDAYVDKDLEVGDVDNAATATDRDFTVHGSGNFDAVTTTTLSSKAGDRIDMNSGLSIVKINVP